MFDDNGLNDVEILSLDDVGYFDEIEENGGTFEENSLIKASVPASLGYIGIADDSGLCVDALNGAPGVYSARFAGENATDQLNNKKLLDSLGDLLPEKRTAHFVCVISCVIPHSSGFSPLIPDKYLSDNGRGSDRSFCVRGECEGVILNEARGENGFGYDPLFFVPSMNKSFAQLTPDEKNRISHRGNAMREFVKVFESVFRGEKC